MDVPSDPCRLPYPGKGFTGSVHLRPAFLDLEDSLCTRNHMGLLGGDSRASIRVAGNQMRTECLSEESPANALFSAQTRKMVIDREDCGDIDTFSYWSSETRVTLCKRN